MRLVALRVRARVPRRVVQALAAVSCGAVIAACGTSSPSASPSATGSGSGASATVSGTTTSPATARSAASVPSGDWPTFGYDAAHSGVGPASGITAANAGSLRLRRVTVDTTVDSAPIELHAVAVRGRPRDVIVVTGDDGRTIAVDAGTGARLWEFRPRGPQAQVTDTTPAADPDRTAVYTASPDGTIHKLSLATGRELWARTITTDPGHEKMDSALTVTGGYVIATTGGYYGDAPPYDGHVVAIDRATGRIAHVFNAECANRHVLIAPTACPITATRGGSALWARAGAIVEPGSGNLLVVTGNGPFNGTTNWGDTVLELAPDASRILHSWTPPNEKTLFVERHRSRLHRARAARHSGRTAARRAGRQAGRALAAGSRPPERHARPRVGPARRPAAADLSAGRPGRLHPARGLARRRADRRVRGHQRGHVGLHADRRQPPRLRTLWSNGVSGTSPVLSGGLLYVYDQQDGRVVIRRPLNGSVVRALQVATGHWNSPIVVGGRVIETTGNYHVGRGPSALEIWHLPGR